MSLAARRKLAALLETAVETTLAERNDEFIGLTPQGAYNEGLKTGVKLTIDTLETGGYNTQVVHIDDDGKDDLVSIIGQPADHEVQLERLSTLLWADVNS